MFALLLAAAALAGTGWMWWQGQAASGEARDLVIAEVARLQANDSELDLKISGLHDRLESVSSLGGGELQALQQRIDDDRAQLARIEQSISEQLQRSGSVQAATEAMHGRLLAAEAALARVAARDLDAGSELDLSEVEYLLRLAEERLQLFGDPEAAERALAIAETHLAAFDNPSLVGVRREVAAAREALAAANLPDYVALADELDALQASIPGLPFRGEATTAQAPATATDAGWWEKLKSALGSLVTIRRSEQEADATISLEDKDYVRQRLWLQVEIAHLSLMRRDGQAFRNALERAAATVSGWFDATDAQVQAAQASIARLAAAELDAELPDIGKPWSTLRALRSAAPAPSPPLPVDNDEAATPAPLEEPAATTTDGAE